MLQSKRLVVLGVLIVAAAAPVAVIGLLLAGALAVAPVKATTEVVEAPVILEEAPIVIDEAPLVEESLVGLPQPAEGEALYVNEEDGYALLYPSAFTVEEPADHIVVVSGPDEFPGPEPSRGWLNIDASRPAEGRTAVDFSDEIVAEFMPFPDGFFIERTDWFLGGEPAVEILGVPGQNLSWQVVAIHNGALYHLTFSPLGEENGQAFVDMQVIYEIVMRSFTFID